MQKKPADVQPIAFTYLLHYSLSMRKPFAILIALLFILSSCTVTETLDVSASGPGSSAADIKVEQFFINVLYDFAEFLPEDNESIMDSAIDDFSNQLTSLPSITAASAEKTGENQYALSFDYTDIPAVLADFGVTEQSLFEITENSFAFHLDISNYPELKSIVPFLADPNFEVYGPEFNQGMSEADYLEMISFLLGEEGPDAISNGNITINLNVPGTITDAQNAEIIDENTISYSFPVIKFLLLAEPLSFSVSWS